VRVDHMERSWRVYLADKLGSGWGLPRGEAAKEADLLLKWIRRHGARLAHVAHAQINLGQDSSTAHPPPRNSAGAAALIATQPKLDGMSHPRGIIARRISARRISKGHAGRTAHSAAS
jgi:hypothetical protein